jgi:hypothetical protein
VLRLRALVIDERAGGHIRFEHKADHIGCWSPARKICMPPTLSTKLEACHPEVMASR